MRHVPWKLLIVRGLCAALTGAAPLPSFAQQAGARGPIYYDISRDPESPSLLHIDNIQEDGEYLILLKTDLFAAEPKFGLETILRFDCAARTMRTIAAAQLIGPTPTPANMFRPIEIDDVLKPESSVPAGIKFDLVCTGEGRLVPQRVFEGDYTRLLTDFWER